MERLSVVEREELWDRWEGWRVATVDQPMARSVSVDGPDSVGFVGLETSCPCWRMVFVAVVVG